MSATLPRTVVFAELIRDLRHLEARAASDLVDWLVHLEAKGMADRSIYGYSRQVAKLLRQFPDKPLQEFTDTNIERVLALTPRQSRHITQSILNQFFLWAKRKRRIAENPMDYVDRVKKLPRRPRDIFSEAEVALLEALPSPDGELFTILFGSGIRRGEARMLLRSDIDLKREHLIVHKGKGGEGRIVPLPEQVLAAVADLDLYERLERTDYLWYTERGQGRYRWHGTPVSDSRIDIWYRKRRDAAGVRPLNLHQTRHTYHWLLKDRGYSLEERSLLLGHDSTKTTEKQYGRISIEAVAQRMAEIGL